MSKILAEYPSKSNPAKSYHIIRGDDGVTYCNCKSWAFSPPPKTCKHLTYFLKHHGNKYTIRQTEDKLILAINEAVEMLR